jgi:hypothetical protein
MPARPVAGRAFNTKDTEPQRTQREENQKVKNQFMSCDIELRFL